MALAISSIPVLTGEVADYFESEAQKTYEQYMNRSAKEKASVQEKYKRGQELVNKVLSKSHISCK